MCVGIVFRRRTSFPVFISLASFYWSAFGSSLKFNGLDFSFIKHFSVLLLEDQVPSFYSFLGLLNPFIRILFFNDNQFEWINQRIWLYNSNPFRWWPVCVHAKGYRLISMTGDKWCNSIKWPIYAERATSGPRSYYLNRAPARGQIGGWGRKRHHHRTKGKRERWSCVHPPKLFSPLHKRMLGWRRVEKKKSKHSTAKKITHTKKREAVWPLPDRERKESSGWANNDAGSCMRFFVCLSQDPFFFVVVRVRRVSTPNPFVMLISISSFTDEWAGCLLFIPAGSFDAASVFSSRVWCFTVFLSLEWIN